MRREMGIRQDGSADLHGVMSEIALDTKRGAELAVNGCGGYETVACKAFDSEVNA